MSRDSEAQEISCATFLVSASACPQLLCKLLGYVAQQARLIDNLIARCRADRMVIVLCVSGLDAHRAQVLAEKFRSVVAVNHVKLSLRSRLKQPTPAKSKA